VVGQLGAPRRGTAEFRDTVSCRKAAPLITHTTPSFYTINCRKAAPLKRRGGGVAVKRAWKVNGVSFDHSHLEVVMHGHAHVDDAVRAVQLREPAQQSAQPRRLPRRLAVFLAVPSPQELDLQKCLESQKGTEEQQWERNIYTRLPPREGGLSGLAGVTTRPAGYPSGGVPPATERQLHLLTYWRSPDPLSKAYKSIAELMY
jgi:hypothetical protein